MIKKESGVANQRETSPIGEIKNLLDKGTITTRDLSSLIKTYEIKLTKDNSYPTPEEITKELEGWYKHLGIEKIIKDFSLSPCPFVKNEIAEAERNNQTILAVPKGVSAAQLTDLFGIKSNYNLDDKLIGLRKFKREDCWFVTPKTEIPEHLGYPGYEIEYFYKKEGKLGMSIGRYLTFLARMKELTGKFPDKNYWSFLLSSNFDRSGAFVAGIDVYDKLSCHGWMDSFYATFAGGSHCILPPRIEIRKETENL